MAVGRCVDNFLLEGESLVQIHVFMILEVNIPEKNVFGAVLIIWL